MEFSKLESLSEHLRNEYGVPSVLEVVGRRFAFIFRPKNDEVSVIAGTITGAMLEYPLNHSQEPDEPIATLNLTIQAPEFQVQNNKCSPKEIMAWMYINQVEGSEEKLKWILYVYSSLDKYMEGDNDEAFEGEFRLLD
jgi:hypothetical protein